MVTQVLWQFSHVSPVIQTCRWQGVTLQKTEVMSQDDQDESLTAAMILSAASGGSQSGKNGLVR